MNTFLKVQEVCIRATPINSVDTERLYTDFCQVSPISRETFCLFFPPFFSLQTFLCRNISFATIDLDLATVFRVFFPSGIWQSSLPGRKVSDRVRFESLFLFLYRLLRGSIWRVSGWFILDNRIRLQVFLSFLPGCPYSIWYSLSVPEDSWCSPKTSRLWMQHTTRAFSSSSFVEKKKKKFLTSSAAQKYLLVPFWCTGENGSGNDSDLMVCFGMATTSSAPWTSRTLLGMSLCRAHLTHCNRPNSININKLPSGKNRLKKNATNLCPQTRQEEVIFQ